MPSRRDEHAGALPASLVTVPAGRRHPRSPAVRQVDRGPAGYLRDLVEKWRVLACATRPPRRTPVKSISEQTDVELGGAWSVLVRQKRDHVELDRLLDDLVVATGRDRDTTLRRVARLVFPHAFAEESVLWPELRRCLPEGGPLTLRVEQEHQEINELWLRLEIEELPGVERQQVVDRLVEVLREDVRDEEDVLLPRLQESVDVRRLRRLGVAWETVRRIAPTRPHPVVSRRPAGNVLAALPLTVWDRSRDRLDAAADRVPRAAGPLAAAGGAITRLSLLLEHLPALRHGEDPRTRAGTQNVSGHGHA